MMPIAIIAVSAVVAIAVTLTPPAPVSTAVVPADRENDTLRVLSWNVKQAPGGNHDLITLIEKLKPDIAVFAELYGPDPGVVPDSDWPAGYQAIGAPSIAVTVLIADDLGRYELVDSDASGRTSGLTVGPRDSGSPSPDVVAVHLTRPSLAGGVVMWEDGVDWVASQCRSPNTVAAGDFNSASASFEGRIGTCAVGSGKEVRGSSTWPAWLPAPFGAQIDHVASGSDWTVTWLRTLTAGHSDHRPIFGVLERSA
ncbi:MAG: hypothetical protein RI885_709 [Actinomycetota bacterium]